MEIFDVTEIVRSSGARLIDVAIFHKRNEDIIAGLADRSARETFYNKKLSQVLD